MEKKKNWPNNKYYEYSRETIKTIWDTNRDVAAAAGTKMHYDIECYYNKCPNKNDSIEYMYFENFLKDYPNLKPYRTEWTIFEEPLKLAGSIDMVFKDSDTDELYIYDWKRTKKIWYSKINQDYAIPECIQHIPSTNYWHYTFQLNAQFPSLLLKNIFLCL